MNKTVLQQRLDHFDPTINFNRGSNSAIFIIWYLTKYIFFLSFIPWPSALKATLLRWFGASVGHDIVIKPRVNIHFPWRFSLGNHSWIGEGVEIYNFAPVTVGSHVCLSQQVFLCSGDHDFRDLSFSYRNKPISIGDGVWLQARVFVCPGVSIGRESVVTACSLVKDDLPGNNICSGTPAIPLSFRWKGQCSMT